MTTVSKINERASIDTTKYINIETGETMSSELNGNKITITATKKGKQFMINSNDFVTFTTEAIDYLYRELNNTDIGKLTSMANMLKTDCSILCQDNDLPHDSETLCLTLNMNLNKFYEFVRRLVKKNILSYCVCAPSGYVQKIYMLNPYIARKRSSFNCELHCFFRNVTQDGKLKD